MDILYRIKGLLCLHKASSDGNIEGMRDALRMLKEGERVRQGKWVPRWCQGGAKGWASMETIAVAHEVMESDESAEAYARGFVGGNSCDDLEKVRQQAADANKATLASDRARSGVKNLFEYQAFEMVPRG